MAVEMGSAMQVAPDGGTCRANEVLDQQQSLAYATSVRTAITLTRVSEGSRRRDGHRDAGGPRWPNLPSERSAQAAHTQLTCTTRASDAVALALSASERTNSSDGNKR